MGRHNVLVHHPCRGELASTHVVSSHHGGYNSHWLCSVDESAATLCSTLHSLGVEIYMPVLSSSRQALPSPFDLLSPMARELQDKPLLLRRDGTGDS